MFFAQELLCNIHRSNIACRSSLFVSVQALRDSCGYSVIKENITLPHFKHFLAYSWTETGFHSIFNSAVILEITYACGKPRTIVISKRKPAPFEQQRVSVPIEEQEQKCLSVCAIRWWECVKRVLLFPRLERQTQATNDVRPSAHIMWHEQRTGVTCSTRVPGVFGAFYG